MNYDGHAYYQISSICFFFRLSLLEEWRGVRDEQLSSLSGIKGCIFVHASGFIGGNETREGALEMARKTLQHRESFANGKCYSDSELMQVESKEN